MKTYQIISGLIGQTTKYEDQVAPCGMSKHFSRNSTPKIIGTVSKQTAVWILPEFFFGFKKEANKLILSKVNWEPRISYNFWNKSCD